MCFRMRTDLHERMVAKNEKASLQAVWQGRHKVVPGIEFGLEDDSVEVGKSGETTVQGSDAGVDVDEVVLERDARSQHDLSHPCAPKMDTQTTGCVWSVAGEMKL